MDKQEDFLYTSFVVDTAIQQIVQIIPQWESLQKEMKEKLVVHIAHGSGNGDSYCSGESHHVILEQSGEHNAQTFTDNFLTAVHELVHALVKEYLFGKRVIRTKDSDTPQFMSVIQEGSAITVEQAVIQLYNLKAEPDRLPKWATTRMLKTVAVLQNRKAKDLSQVGKLAHYTEGIRLARRLAKTGWRVEDLPQALEHVHDTALNLKGSDDAMVFYDIEVTYDPKSEYQRILTAIFAGNEAK